MDIVQSMFNHSVFAGFVVGMLSLIAISYQRSDIHTLILTDVVECAMLVIIAAVGTDLAEALILPGLVVGLAEFLVVSEILIQKSKLREKKKDKKISKLFEEFLAVKEPEIVGKIEHPKMEVLYSAPRFIGIILVVYGAFLTGFTGGAVMSVGLLFYLLSQGMIDKKISSENIRNFWEAISGFSGVMWAFWILFGFIGFYLFPHHYVTFLLIAGGALALKVGSKLGLIGDLKF
ncbi:MAG TPA: DUF2105 domain-containing protein [Methanothermococcus okinawensis]|nr:DUF2105 domain-containing protein [Methanothermococcus okinawensis]